MALLNPPELRASVQVVLVNYLASRHGQRDKAERLISTLAPDGLAGSNPDHDVRRNLAAAQELGLVVRTAEDDLALAGGVRDVAGQGDSSIVALMRVRVLSEALNTAPWGTQKGARDLTNALAWFLSFPAHLAPLQMEGGGRSAKELQERDFGPRQSLDPDADDPSGWPISNATRWNAFRRWACSLGFAWVSPKGNLVPDPTPAIRHTLPTVFDDESVLPARDFVERLGAAVPVLDLGGYRQFVESNWRRPQPEQPNLSSPLSDALERLRAEGRLVFEDRADAPRVTRDDGTTFSNVGFVRPA
jgi:hypothetical protein